MFTFRSIPMSATETIQKEFDRQKQELIQLEQFYNGWEQRLIEYEHQLNQLEEKLSEIAEGEDLDAKIQELVDQYKTLLNKSADKVPKNGSTEQNKELINRLHAIKATLQNLIRSP